MTLSIYINIVMLGFIITGAFLYMRRQNELNKKIEQLTYKNRLIKMESKALQSQMNPHFIYNSLSTVQYLVMINKNEKAFDFLSDFSLLLRQMIENGSKPYILLNDEIGFLKKYVELERLRFNDKFNYSFNLDILPETGNCYIPAMMVQPLVENAIKHGLAPRKDREGAQLEIHISAANNILKCRIEDNGIGMKKNAAFFSSPNSKNTALQIITERLKLINAVSDKNGSIEVIDKSGNNDNEVGVIVELFLPIMEVYE